jgi:two-component sensor histidine kinase
MAIHELATNAGKYGALSCNEGRVEIGWRLERTGEHADIFVIEWRESGGPKVTPPARSGFGATVIGAMAEISLDAAVELDYAPSGLNWRLRCSVEAVLEHASVTIHEMGSPASLR